MLVRWTEPATDDLTHICDYTEERFGAAQARRTVLVIYAAANSLKDMPRQGTIRPQARNVGTHGLRSPLHGYLSHRKRSRRDRQHSARLTAMAVILRRRVEIWKSFLNFTLNRHTKAAFQKW